jgi:cytochrome b561
MTLTDSPTHYGLVTRFLHWLMAALIVWQLTGMVLKEILGRVPLMAFWVGTHGSVGTLLFALILLRLGWALTQRRHRPVYNSGFLGRAAAVGHFALYALLLIVPALAVLRMLGNGKPVKLFGVLLRPETGKVVPWMTEPANLLHGSLAWLLMALILGHIAMVLLHRFWWRDDVLHRMAGSADRL